MYDIFIIIGLFFQVKKSCLLPNQTVLESPLITHDVTVWNIELICHLQKPQFQTNKIYNYTV